MDAIIAMDVEHRELLQEAERLRAEVKLLSRLVGEARRDKDVTTADSLTQKSRALGDEERVATEAMERVATTLRDELLDDPERSRSRGPGRGRRDDNIELRRWWPGMDEGKPFPEFAQHQKVPHWEAALELGILDLEAGARIAGSMFPLFRGAGSGLIACFERAPGPQRRRLRGDPPTDVRAHGHDDVDRPPAQVGRRHVRHRARRAVGDTDGRGTAHVDARRRDP